VVGEDPARDARECPQDYSTASNPFLMNRDGSRGGCRGCATPAPPPPPPHQHKTFSFFTYTIFLIKGGVLGGGGGGAAPPPPPPPPPPQIKPSSYSLLKFVYLISYAIPQWCMRSPS